jgi:hypothetical protein
MKLSMICEVFCFFLIETRFSQRYPDAFLSHSTHFCQQRII